LDLLLTRKYYKKLGWDDVLRKQWLVVIIEALIYCESNNVKFVTYYCLRKLVSQRIEEFNKEYHKRYPDKPYYPTSLSHRAFEDIIRDNTRFLCRRWVCYIHNYRTDDSDDWKKHIKKELHKNRKKETESRVYVKFVAIRQEVQNIRKRNSEDENKLTIHFLPKKYGFLFDSVKIKKGKTRPLPRESVSVSDSVQIKVTKAKDIAKF
jgi:hypothetical protein